MRRLSAGVLLAILTALPAAADNNPSPSQPATAVSPPFGGAGLNAPFPDSVYGADHGGSTFTLSTPYLSPYGAVDSSRGIMTYSCAPFTPRNSEGVYGMDVWLEEQDSSGNWNPASLRGGISDQGGPYQSIDTPNPGPSAQYTFTWTFDSTHLPPSTRFRVFVYVYLYNQGGGTQGNFYVASSLGTVTTAAANTPPRIAWTNPTGTINPGQIQAGQTYVISAEGVDDDGNLIAVRIDKNGQPFAYAGGGDGYNASSENPTSDPAGTIIYTAWSLDSEGAQSPTISWTVVVAGRADQSPVSSVNESVPLGQAFAPLCFGGSGSGGWQFTVLGATNWDQGQSANTGTWLPGGPWVPSWQATTAGTYSFWIVKDGDSVTNPSTSAGPYTLTVAPIPISFSGDPLSFVYNALPQGPALVVSPNNSTYQISGTTFAVNGGTYSVTATATGNYSGSATIDWKIDPASQAPVAISPATTTLTAGQSATFTASGGSGTGAYLWSGAVVGSLPAMTVGFPTAGAYSLTLIRAGDSNYLASVPATASVVVQSLATPPTASLTANPSSGQAPLTSTLVWTTTQATSATLSGTGLTGGGIAGSQQVTLPTAGTYTYTLTANGPGGQTSQSADIVVSAPPVQVTPPPTPTPPPAPPQYTLVTVAIGNGSVTPGGVYVANTVVPVTATPGAGATFGGWNGSIISFSNPLRVTMTANLILTAAFSSRLPQTITFSPPAILSYPGSAISLNASASSGLPVTLSILSGPGTLSGATLTTTGVGSLVIQATQAGNSAWLPAPAVNAQIMVNGHISVGSHASVFRIRFDTTGHDFHLAPASIVPGTSFLWTDPTSLLLSPWPSFSIPQPAAPGPTDTVLSPTPVAQVLSLP